MSDNEKETLDFTSEQGTSTRNPHEMSNADSFSLLKTYMDTRLSASDFEDEKKIRTADTRAVKKLKSVKSADKKQNVRKRPAEASGFTSQTAHNAIPVSVSMPPFAGADLVTETRSKGPGMEICVSGVDYLDIGHPTAKRHQDWIWSSQRNFIRTSAHIRTLYSYRVKVRQLAKICGKLIALTPAVGNVTQIMTRNIFSVINIRDYWDQYVNIGKYPDCINELIFWRDNLPLLKAVDLKIFSTGFWKNTQVKHTELKIWLKKMKNSVIDSKARNTTTEYTYSYKRFVVWSEKYTEINSFLPANEIYVNLYLQYLMQSAKHYSTIEAACYAIK
ncbi:unnamed protein product [Mytilus edulis]|uniref:Uncharacterized protein n=1 Tax=Mytilus edulis TaxID=6550 RepID=A0A8S3S646_MYTED|nr:unnamed protein product [Mytilus edulis]